MLVLTRQDKTGKDCIALGKQVCIKVLEVRPNGKVRIGIEAPTTQEIVRLELLVSTEGYSDAITNEAEKLRQHNEEKGTGKKDPE